MSPRKRNPFDEMDIPCEEDHPLDVLAHRRLSSELKEKRKVATQKLMDALGGNITPWLDLEPLLNESIIEREEILYNIGFEHGVVSGKSKAFTAIHSGKPGKEYRRFANDMRKRALFSELPETVRVAALLEVAWALALELK
jgi:hypothetical protein